MPGQGLSLRDGAVEVPGTLVGSSPWGLCPAEQALSPKALGWLRAPWGMPSEHHHLPPSLQELKDFIQKANAGLNKPLEEGDYDGLVEVMGHLMRVKERQATTDNMFEPLKETVALLSTYGQEMPEEIHLQLHVS